MMAKVIFFDADGTLISHSQNAVPQSSRDALEKLKEKGIKRVLATGRHMTELKDLPIRDINFDGYITVNGQLCLDKKGTIIWESPISGSDKDALIELFNEKQVPITLTGKDRMYINFVNSFVEQAQTAVSSPIPKVGQYNGEEIYLAIAYLDKESDELISERLPGCKATRWNQYGVDIIAATGGKIVGIKEYLRANNLTAEDAMAFGDGENDIDMLKFVKTGVAMGNASDKIKACADFVAPSVDEDGIKRALEDLGIL